MKSMKGKIFLFFAVLTVCILLGLRLWVDKYNLYCIISKRHRGVLWRQFNWNYSDMLRKEIL